MAPAIGVGKNGCMTFDTSAADDMLLYLATELAVILN